MFAPMQAYSHLRLVRERSLMLKSYFTALTNPKARKDLPRAGKEKENPENSGSSEVNYPTDDSLDHCIDQHATPSEQGHMPGHVLQGTRGEGAGHVRLKTMSGDVQLCDRN